MAFFLCLSILVLKLRTQSRPGVVDDEPRAEVVVLGGGDAGVVAPLLAREAQGMAEVRAALVPPVHVAPPPAAAVRTGLK